MSTKRKIIITIGLVFIIILVFVIGLYISNYLYWKLPSRSVYRISKTVPLQNIGYIDHHTNSLGFINTDSSEKTLIHFPFDFRMPEVSKDGNFIYGIDDRWLSRSVFWDIKAHKVYACHPDQWGVYSQVIGTEDPVHPEYAMVNNNDQVLLLDIKKCLIVNVILDQAPGLIIGISYNAEDKILLYGLRYWQTNPDSEGQLSATIGYQLRNLDLTTNENTQIASGIDPAWSPDGKMISYTGVDGLYVMNADGSNSRRIFNYPKVKYIETLSPYSHWSPDGRWLVYEYCEQPKTNPPTICPTTPIYKISSAGGIPDQILDDGKFPFWMP